MDLSAIVAVLLISACGVTARRPRRQYHPRRLPLLGPSPSDPQPWNLAGPSTRTLSAIYQTQSATGSGGPFPSMAANPPSSPQSNSSVPPDSSSFSPGMTTSFGSSSSWTGSSITNFPPSSSSSLSIAVFSSGDPSLPLSYSSPSSFIPTYFPPESSPESQPQSSAGSSSSPFSGVQSVSPQEPTTNVITLTTTDFPVAPITTQVPSTRFQTATATGPQQTTRFFTTVTFITSNGPSTWTTTATQTLADPSGDTGRAPFASNTTAILGVSLGVAALVFALAVLLFLFCRSKKRKKKRETVGFFEDLERKRRTTLRLDDEFAFTHGSATRATSPDNVSIILTAEHSAAVVPAPVGGDLGYGSSNGERGHEVRWLEASAAMTGEAQSHYLPHSQRGTNRHERGSTSPSPRPSYSFRNTPTPSAPLASSSEMVAISGGNDQSHGQLGQSLSQAHLLSKDDGKEARHKKWKPSMGFKWGLLNWRSREAPMPPASSSSVSAVGLAPSPMPGSVSSSSSSLLHSHHLHPLPQISASTNAMMSEPPRQPGTADERQSAPAMHGFSGSSHDPVFMPSYHLPSSKAGIHPLTVPMARTVGEDEAPSLGRPLSAILHTILPSRRPSSLLDPLPPAHRPSIKPTDNRRLSQFPFSSSPLSGLPSTSHDMNPTTTSHADPSYALPAFTYEPSFPAPRTPSPPPPLPFFPWLRNESGYEGAGAPRPGEQSPSILSTTTREGLVDIDFARERERGMRSIRGMPSTTTFEREENGSLRDWVDYSRPVLGLHHTRTRSEVTTESSRTLTSTMASP